ncbi:MAG: iron-containing alcohol dehydrogenase, partial [Planctomycetes bacterium]|nr:iron-containing alcohol dehydrogenase [Planctomycetota bacterium]
MLVQEREEIGQQSVEPEDIVLGFEAVGTENVPYAVGGGKVLDVTKMAAKKLNLPYISVPTSLSTDGISSPFAVIDCDDPEREGPVGNHTFQTFVPLGVIVDL